VVTGKQYLAQYLEQDAKLTSLRTRDDVKRYVAERADRNASEHAALVRRQQVFRRAMLIVGLTLSMAQYGFFIVGVEILSIPSLTVFVPWARVG
jgi:hypothetical protein